MSTHLAAPDPFWPNGVSQPTPEVWKLWKKMFRDYVHLLTVLNPTVKIDEKDKIWLLRTFLGGMGQRYFDSLDLDDYILLSEAINELDKMWKAQTNVFVHRYHF